VFAFLGIALAGIAAYAVVMHYVTDARREVGVRRALGAKGRHIAGLVVRQSAWPTLIGSSAGVVAIIWLSKVGAKMGLAVNPLGAFDYALTVVGLLVLVLIASAAPTVAALRITPSRILREG
jgi:putative ABC transport system permease protein